MRHPTGTGSPTLVTTSLKACDLPLEIRSDRSVTDVAAEVVASFASPGRGRYSLHLDLDAGIDDLNVLRFRSWGRRDVHIGIGAAKKEPVAAAIGCLLVAALMDNRGLLLHGAYLLKSGRAHVFVGSSGAGKSTLARNASRVQYVHEEKVGVRRRRGRWWAYGVPMLDNDGRPGRDAAAPLAGVYLIEKGARLQKFPAKRRQALLELPFHTVLPLDDDRARYRSFATLFSLAGEVPLWRLRFAKSSDVSTII